MPGTISTYRTGPLVLAAAESLLIANQEASLSFQSSSLGSGSFHDSWDGGILITHTSRAPSQDCSTSHRSESIRATYCRSLDYHTRGSPRSTLLIQSKSI
jgi:hypothetical protein